MYGVRRLSDIEAEQFVPLECGAELVARADGTYTGRGAREEQVAHAQGHVLRHAGDEPVHCEKHLGGVARLAAFAVHVEGEPKALHVAAQVGESEELRGQGRRVVEGFGPLPRKPFGDGLSLQVAGREVDADPHLVVVAVCETLGNGLPDTVDPHDEFTLVVYLLRETRDVEGVVVAQHGRVGLEEPDRFGPHLGQPCRVVQLLGMGPVVASDTDDLHVRFF